MTFIVALDTFMIRKIASVNPVQQVVSLVLIKKPVMLVRAQNSYTKINVYLYVQLVILQLQPSHKTYVKNVL